MDKRDWFEDLPEDFEESVRIDREGRDHRWQAIDSYHVTSDSRQFIRDFVDRTLGDTDDMRAGSNYWLYGYYGSGKSHLLTVLDGLMNTSWVEGQHNALWDAFRPGKLPDDVASDFDALYDRWQQVHDTYHVIPISINLLKYQGQKKRSFSEIVLRHAHQDPDLTGIHDDISTGFSPQLEVAYFEDWYRTTGAWPERQERAADILREVTSDSTEYDWSEDQLWSDIQQYGALADVVLPRLFENITGTTDGYTDLQPSDIDPEAVVTRLEELRREREAELDKEVKLVLLLDEVSLFIGTDFERLTELQTLAENVDEIGDGDIQLVATAQAKIEDVQPQFAAHGADFSIVKDRFPHRYQLPSKHVGDIAKRRLLSKTESGERGVRRILEEASVKPWESLVYNETKQNTNPPLDSIDREDLIEFYPFLPYHAPLFLEILFNLRQEATNPAKSIFSGTARAILAVMHGLLHDWANEGESDHLVTLIDFYELVKPELRDIITQQVRVIEGSDATDGIADEVENGSLTEFDLDVAKAVLLLQNVDHIVPMNEGNIAVAVMSDLNGSSWISTANRVEDSLNRLEKFIRPNEDETGPQYRFATQEERLIYDEAEANEINPDWDAVLKQLDEHLWSHIAEDLSLPESIPYGDSGDEYPISYQFSVDGTWFETTRTQEGGLDVHIEIQGLDPKSEPKRDDEETLYWEINGNGFDELRKRLVDWWALRDAVATRDAPPAVDRDLERRAETVRNKIRSAMEGGRYTVKDQTGMKSLSKAVQAAVDISYPDDFHPMMLQVNEDRLHELAELDGDDPLPGWARTIQIPSSAQVTEHGERTIQNNVLSLTGRQLKTEEAGLALETVLNGIVKKRPYYDEVQPAIRAILWGFCREGRLLPVDEDGNTLENDVLLTGDQRSDVRLKLLDAPNIGKILEEHNFKETTETVAEGLITVQRANEQLASKLTGLREDVRLVLETDIHTKAVSHLLEQLDSELVERIAATEDRLSTIKAQDEGLEDAIAQTRTVETWFEEDVSDVWNRRLSSLYRWDAQLLIGDDRFAWVDEQAHSAVTSRRDTITGFDDVWWTSDGWGTLIERLSPDPTPELERSWEDFTAEHNLEAFVDRIEDHPWVVPARELPAGVHNSFAKRYITPLRNVKQWYETIDNALQTLADDGGEALVETANDIANVAEWSSVADADVSELMSRLDQLSETVGERTPDDVDRIGIVPDDRHRLEQRLERLVEQGNLDLTTTDSGVIVR